MDRLVQTLREILAEGGHPVDMLVRAFEAHFEFAREDPDRARFAFALLLGPQRAELVPELETCGREKNALMAAVVQGLVEAGTVAAERVEACTMACGAFVVHSILDFLYRGGDLGPGLARRLVEDLLRGFAKPGAIDREGRS
jgi:hypothetical protein